MVCHVPIKTVTITETNEAGRIAKDVFVTCHGESKSVNINPFIDYFAGGSCLVFTPQAVNGLRLMSEQELQECLRSSNLKGVLDEAGKLISQI
jgi:hypothetical protein